MTSHRQHSAVEICGGNGIGLLAGWSHGPSPGGILLGPGSSSGAGRSVVLHLHAASAIANVAKFG